MTVTFADEINKNCPHDDYYTRWDMINIKYYCLYCEKLLKVESRLKTMKC